MAIQWFPGHMHKAQLQIRKILPRVDLLIEMLDARIPFSSENPMLAELRGEKPCLKVLSKCDLADPKQTSRWKASLEQQRNIKVKTVTTAQTGTIARLTDACHQMVPHRRSSEEPIRTLIVGVPNVGKSTLINTLAGRKVAKTGNEPAITKEQQEIDIGKGIVLFDTPGVLWPKVESVSSGYRLAAIGSIRDTAMEYADVAYFVAGYLSANYFQALSNRYSLEKVPDDEISLLDAIGKKRGCLAKGGVVDYDRTSRIFINDLRSGALGPITLETPELIAEEAAAQKLIEDKKQERKEARKEARLADFKTRKSKRSR